MHHNLPRLIGAFCFFAILLAACGDEPTPVPASTLTLIPPTATFTPVPPTETPTPLPPAPNPLAVLSPQPTFAAPQRLSDEARNIVAAVLADADSRADGSALDVLGLKTVLWSQLTCDDTALIEAQPAARLDDGHVGYRVIVGDERQVFVYHATAGGDLLYCEDANLLNTYGAALQFDTLAADLVDVARRSLAQRLGVDVDDIRAVDTLTLVWPDSSLGCPQEDANYTAQRIPGYRFLLEHGGAYYTYHADFLTAIYCPLERERLPQPFAATPTPTPTPDS